MSNYPTSNVSSFDADHVLHEAVEKEQARAERAPEKVSIFLENVEATARVHIQDIRQETGSDISTVSQQITMAVTGYRQAKESILDPDALVRDTACKGAAAWVNKGTGEKAYDAGAMGVHIDKGYWERTELHELVHEEDQAATFDADVLEYYDNGRWRQASVVGDLTEGQATQVNEVSDLTIQYQKHQIIWRRIAASVGEQRLAMAMKTGDILDLQGQLYEQQRPRYEMAA